MLFCLDFLLALLCFSLLSVKLLLLQLLKVLVLLSYFYHLLSLQLGLPFSFDCLHLAPYFELVKFLLGELLLPFKLGASHQKLLRLILLCLSNLSFFSDSFLLSRLFSLLALLL